MSAGLGVAWAQPNSEAHVYSPYEEQTIARVLARHGVTVDATPEGKTATIKLSDLRAAGLQMTDLATRQSSLEDIFVDLVRERA